MVAGFLILTLLVPIFAYVLIPQAYAVTEYTWETTADFSTGTAVDTASSSDRITLAQDMSGVVTDTTYEDFSAGTTNWARSSVATSTSDDGYIRLATDYRYNPETDPEYPLYPGYTSLDVDTGILYAGGWYTGIRLFDTKKTLTTSDDTMERYGYDLVPDSRLYGLSLDKESGFLFHGPHSNGCRLIDTKKTASIVDDEFAGEIPGCGRGSQFDFFSDIYAVFIKNFGSTFSVVDMKGSTTTADDTYFTYTTATTPAMPTNTVNVVVGDEGHGLVYIGTAAGLAALDTKHTATSTDDTVFVYNGTSTPALPNNNVSNVIYNETLDILYVYTAAGLTIIDTFGTATTGDDVIIEDVYDPTILPGGAYNGASVGDYIYITLAGDGIYVVDTKGTKDVSDDERIYKVVKATHPLGVEADKLPEIVTIDPDSNVLFLTYVSYGVGMVDITETNSYTYVPDTRYTGSIREIANTPTTSITIGSTITTDESVSLQYRTGNSDILWRDDFATSSSYAGDLYGWAAEFQSATVTDGVLSLSNPNASWGALVVFDPGVPVNYFPAGSLITARIRMNNSDITREYNDWMFTDDWEDGDTFYDTVNQWITITLTPSSPFSTVAFEPFFVDYGGWGTEDIFEIDWVQIETPIDWNSWSISCYDTACPIDPLDLINQTYIQYKTLLETTNPNTTPYVHSVSYTNGYLSTGTYTSEEITLDLGMKPLSLSANTTVPTGTTLSLTYSTDHGTTWLPMTSDHTFDTTFAPTTFMWQATLTTDSPTTTPTINSVTLLTGPMGGAQTGSYTVQRKVANLEADGKYLEAAILRDRFQHLFKDSDSTGDERTMEQILVLLSEVVVRLEMLAKLRGELGE